MRTRSPKGGLPTERKQQPPKPVNLKTHRCIGCGWRIFTQYTTCVKCSHKTVQ